jgi:hypothetical protein
MDGKSQHVRHKRSFIYKIISSSIILYEVFHLDNQQESNIRPVFLKVKPPAETGII